MSDSELERRLRGTLAARADRITPDRLQPAVPPTVSARPGPARRVARWWMPVLGGAALITAVVLARPSAPHPLPPTGPAVTVPATTPPTGPAVTVTATTPPTGSAGTSPSPAVSASATATERPTRPVPTAEPLPGDPRSAPSASVGATTAP